MHATLFGLIVADLIGRTIDLRRPPVAGGLQLIDSITLTTGGNVCNVGVAMARLGLSVAAAGLVGDDDLGSAVRAKLQSAGLDISSVNISPGGQTSATVVAVEPGGERCFFHAPGVTPLLDAAAFRQCFDIFKKSQWVQIGYFGLLPALTAQLPELLAELRQYAPQTKIALDTVNPPAERNLLDPILPHLDLFAPSRPEAQALTGQVEAREMVADFRTRMKRGIIGIKLDVEGCFLDDGQQSASAPIYPVTVADTTGAGDTWFAGLLTALIHQMPLERAARFANRVAADCCTAAGASAGIRSFQETLQRV